jgi:crotonobetainyl-CoA:carnitine CoA-transferase CaiB-like acyl-CoA transferase
VVDKSTACFVAQAITAALFHRERSGEAQHIDLSMVDASLNFFWADGMMTETMLDCDVVGGPTLSDLYSVTQCADGQLIYFAGNNDQRLGLFRALRHPEWCTADLHLTRMRGNNEVEDLEGGRMRAR